MSRLRDLPIGLSLPFSVAEAQEAGATPRRLRGRDLGREYAGVRGALPDNDESAEERIRRLALTLSARMRPCEFFSHGTAAVLWGLPVPARILDRERSLDVATFTPDRPSRAQSIRGHEIVAGSVSVIESLTQPIRATCPASTWVTLASELDRDELVVVGDAVVREPMIEGDRAALSSPAELSDRALSHRRVGGGRLRAALPLIRTRSRSPEETRLRLILAQACLPEPELNYPVLLSPGTAILDFAYPHCRLGLEYEGRHHATDIRQWERDLQRYERLADLGWRIIRVTHRDRQEPDALLARVEMELASRSFP